MSVVSILSTDFANRRELFDARFTSSETFKETVQALLFAYTQSNTWAILQEGEEAAEEVFDLTNNPAREAECRMIFGEIKPVSVGDVVEVWNGPRTEQYLCLDIGWALL